jgi:hypothetical protein
LEKPSQHFIEPPHVPVVKRGKVKDGVKKTEEGRLKKKTAET